MGAEKTSVSNNKLPEVKKKTILQQVMKPKDWVAIGILVVVSAICWIWVLKAYQTSISPDNLVSGQLTFNVIDKNSLL